MNAPSTWSTAVLLTIAGMLAVAAGIVIQIASGVDDFPRIPPGVVISLAVAALVAFGARWWWTPIVGTLFAIFLLVGAVVSDSTDKLTDRLGDPGEFGAFIGTVVMFLGIAVALVAGIVATMQNHRPRTGPGQTSPTIPG